jgi:hypothetical protein
VAATVRAAATGKPLERTRQGAIGRFYSVVINDSGLVACHDVQPGILRATTFRKNVECVKLLASQPDIPPDQNLPLTRCCKREILRKTRGIFVLSKSLAENCPLCFGKVKYA